MMWNPSLYDDRHSFISKFGESLIACLSPCPGERICDIGCGTGDLAHQLFEKQVSVVGIDSSEAMIVEARQKYPAIEFYVQDVRRLSLEGEFDAVFSNAALHWVPEAAVALQQLLKILKPGGRLVAEFGGKDNVAGILNALYYVLDDYGLSYKKSCNPWYFPSVSEYTGLLEGVGFVVREVAYFDRPTALDDGMNGLRNWIRMFASVFFDGLPNDLIHRMLNDIETRTSATLLVDGVWHADYKRLRLHAVRPVDA